MTQYYMYKYAIQYCLWCVFHIKKKNGVTAISGFPSLMHWLLNIFYGNPVMSGSFSQN